MNPARLVPVPDRYPPLSVWEDCDAAGRRAQELRDEGRALHFCVDEASGGLVIELRDLEGRALRPLSLRSALAIADGGPV